MPTKLPTLLKELQACDVCVSKLPLGPRPVVAATVKSRIMIIGQAPGTKVHASGVPWDDASGDHLREWLAVDKATFYNPDNFAIVPMGFCYPGKKGQGDAPPRPECAPLWHDKLRRALPKLELTLLVGQYAHKHYLGNERMKTLTKTVESFQTYLPEYFVLPHPSWRSKIWMKKNPWFEDDVLPALRKRIN